MAVSWVVPPTDAVGFDGVIAIEVSVAAVTVRVVESSIAPIVAVIVVEPVAALVASPSLPPALLIVAADVTEEVQVAEVVTSTMEASL